MTLLGIESGTITTIHSAMNDQPVLDAYHHTDLRKTRAASQSIIPVDTGLAKGVESDFAGDGRAFYGPGSACAHSERFGDGSDGADPGGYFRGTTLIALYMTPPKALLMGYWAILKSRWHPATSITMSDPA